MSLSLTQVQKLQAKEAIEHLQYLSRVATQHTNNSGRDLLYCWKDWQTTLLNVQVFVKGIEVERLGDFSSHFSERFSFNIQGKTMEYLSQEDTKLYLKSYMTSAIFM